MTDPIAEVCALIGPPDQGSARLVRVRQLTLARPAGSLGYLEDLLGQIAAIRGHPGLDAVRPAVVSVLAGDHGVAERGTSAFPSGHTATVLSLILDGAAPVCILARQVGARVKAADFGLRTPVGDQSYKVAAGTGDIATEDAMSAALARRAIVNGIGWAASSLAGAQVVALGELGVGNTTAAAAITARLLGLPVTEVTGPGSGVAGTALAAKRRLVARALLRTSASPTDPVTTLAALGGYEIAGNVGVILAAASRRQVIVLDGYISGVAALLAVRMCPAVRGYLIAAHRSAEPGHQYVLSELGLRPMLTLDLRLGMASGAALVLSLLDSVFAVARQTPRASRVGLAKR
jgi:nicotinate-nucleotide--dimethylbenzimidazole phosphoribosyltransferase